MYYPNFWVTLMEVRELRSESVMHPASDVLPVTKTILNKWNIGGYH